MYKRLLPLLCGLLFSGFTQAAPVQYTFSGEVTFVEDPEEVISVLAPGINFVGMNAEYVVLIDTARQGEATTFEGDVEISDDFSAPGIGNFDSIFAELVSGSLVDQDNGYFSNFDPEAYEFINWAFSNEYEAPPEISSGVDVGSDDDLLELRPLLSLALGDWTVGTAFRGAERVFASDRWAFGQIISSLEITDITPLDEPPPISAVPIPAGFVLFGTALLGLLGLRRRSGAMPLSCT